MRILRNDFANEEEKIKYVALCEREYESTLTEVCASLAADSCRVIALAGPTCSCKTTTVRKVVNEMKNVGRRIKVISIDDFFHSRDRIKDAEERGRQKIDYDSIDALDFTLFIKCCTDLFEGRAAELPVFDFSSAGRSGYVHCDPADYDVFFFEGIQAFYPEISEFLGAYGSRRVFIDVDGPVEIAGEVFTGRDLRLSRRIVRDFRFRSARPEFTMYLWQSVTENEDKNILPYSCDADIRINSLIPYEPGVLCTPLTEILHGVPECDDCFAAAQSLAEKFSRITPISADYLPEKSMYREFLG